LQKYFSPFYQIAMINEPLYPIGIQDFSEVRRINAVYADKTRLIYKLVNTSKFVFLSRPRRFGKSLLSSTMRYYFEGRKDLFNGLAMEQLEKDWTVYPVLHFDLSKAKSADLDEIRAGISRQLAKFEQKYGNDAPNASIRDRLDGLIQRACELTGQRVVVIIDEYDSPILEVLHDKAKAEEIRNFLRGFYSPLKSCDEYLRFVFITGISVFSQLSIFSELNNLEKITNVNEYSTLCGITKQELLDNFRFGIERLAEGMNLSKEEVVQKLADSYDGYHFSGNSEGVFNPFSLLNAFKYCKLDSYWFGSGTPKFLIEMLGKYKAEGKFDINDLESTTPVSATKFESPIETHTSSIPLLYQSGYLTIKSYNSNANVFSLGIPNSEVRVGLMQNLLPLYSEVDAVDVECVASLASAEFKDGHPDKALSLLQSMLSSMPFMRGDKAILGDVEKTEAYYHRIFYFFFRMLHNEVNAEVRSAKGAADVNIKTRRYIYVVEIKINSTASAALRQIEENGYAAPFLADGREVIKIGVNFSTDTRTITEWQQA
jgi:hypothetical protein